MNRRDFFRGGALSAVGALFGVSINSKKAVPIVTLKNDGVIHNGDVWKIEGTDVTVMVLEVKDDGVTTRYDLIRNYYR